MTDIKIDIDGLQEAVAKMGRYPDLLHKEMGDRMQASIDVLWENVPPYPPPPEESSYIRTGTLGGSLGSSQSGGKGSGKPTVYSVSQSPGGKSYEGKFGTNLSYAKYVIDPKHQAYMHVGRWWTMEAIKKAAETKIKKIWQDMVDFVLGDKP